MSKHQRRDIPRFTNPIFETHCHLDYLAPELRSDALQRAAAAGITEILTIAVSPGNLATVLELTRQAPNLWGTQGIHPHEAAAFDDGVAARIRHNAADERILAIGEIGLDYHYDHAPRAVQREVFERQLQLAVDLDLPVVVHTREADEDTRAILANFSGALRRKGVIHSFTSGLSLARFCLAEGFKLGFNGIVTFNRADNVRAVVAETPVSGLLLETDAPYLTPVPYRGHPNEPCYLPFVAEQVAAIKQLEVETLLAEVYRNSCALFFGVA